MIGKEYFKGEVICVTVENHEMFPRLIDIAPESRELIAAQGKNSEITSIGNIRFLSPEKAGNFPIKFELEGDGIFCQDEIGYMTDQFQRGVIEWSVVFNFKEINNFSILIQPNTEIKIFMWILVDNYPRQSKPKFWKENYDGYFVLLNKKPGKVK